MNALNSLLEQTLFEIYGRLENLELLEQHYKDFILKFLVKMVGRDHHRELACQLLLKRDSIEWQAHVSTVLFEIFSKIEQNFSKLMQQLCSFKLLGKICDETQANSMLDSFTQQIIIPNSKQVHDILALLKAFVNGLRDNQRIPQPFFQSNIELLIRYLIECIQNG